MLKKMASDKSRHGESRFSLGWSKREKRCALGLRLSMYVRPLGAVFFFFIQTSNLVNITYIYVSTISIQASNLYLYRDSDWKSDQVK